MGGMHRGSCQRLIIVPARNEAANLEWVLDNLRRVDPIADILVVDDASADTTVTIAGSLGARVIAHQVRRGYGAALASGYRYALAGGYREVIQCDADGQHHPRYLPRLLEGLEKGYDVVVGSRMLTGGGYRPSTSRRLGMELFSILGWLLCGRRFTDPTSGFMALDARAVRFLAERMPDDYPDVNVLVQLVRAGFSIVEVPVEMQPRRSGQSMTSGFGALRYVSRMLYYLGQLHLEGNSQRLPAAHLGEPLAERQVPPRRVLLANPPTGLFIREDRCQTPVEGISATLRFPIDLAYMAASARDLGCRAYIKDYPAEGLGGDAFETDLRQLEPQCLIVSTTSPTLEKDLQYCRLAKQARPEITTVIKGAQVARQAEAILRETPWIDVVLRDGYEVSAGQVAAGVPLDEVKGISFRRSGRIVENESLPPLLPDDLPFPARELTRNELYLRPDTGTPQTTIQAAWGCPFSCIYCLAPIVSGKKLLTRSPASVVEEVRECVEVHGIREFYFRADTFTLNRDWVMRLCRAIEESGLKISWGCNSRVDTVDLPLLQAMHRAGCWIVGFGVESGSDEMLRRIGKGTTVAQARRAIELCRQAGMKAYAFFMIGFPWETDYTAAQTLRLIKTIGADFIEISIPVPFPGTKLAELVEESGLREAELLDHHHARPVFHPYRMSRSRVMALWKKGYLGFYSRPSQVIRILRGMDSPRHLGNYLRRGGSFFLRIPRLKL